ncbi:hypothetical protein EVAR_100816_1 [Eumeta japonica]|uniref:Uncharacterized protein n=1 Tax=Eumeta variegata TaxID=151549 RepID=A0A4C2A956_EUMVA|nr:hypothetical protein EVAR_100816_1 [Eumeta japonica]
MRWFLIGVVPFTLSSKLHTVANQGMEREELIFLCDVFTIGGHRSFVHDCGLCWFYIEHVVFTWGSQIILIIIKTHDMMNDELLPLHLISRIRRKHPPSLTGVSLSNFIKASF